MFLISDDRFASWLVKKTSAILVIIRPRKGLAALVSLLYTILSYPVTNLGPFSKTLRSRWLAKSARINDAHRSFAVSA